MGRRIYVSPDVEVSLGDCDLNHFQSTVMLVMTRVSVKTGLFNVKPSSMRHPSQLLPAQLAQRLAGTPALLALGLLTLVLGEPMRAHSDALVNNVAPFGILSLQFACSADAARHILNTWNTTDLNHAVLSLSWDCAFALSYGITLALLAERALARLISKGKTWIATLPWLPLFAAGFDLIENLFHFMLIMELPPSARDIAPALACASALGKWGLLGFWLIVLAGMAIRSFVRGGANH